MSTCQLEFSNCVCFVSKLAAIVIVLFVDTKSSTTEKIDTTSPGASNNVTFPLKTELKRAPTEKDDVLEKKTNKNCKEEHQTMREIATTKSDRFSDTPRLDGNSNVWNSSSKSVSQSVTSCPAPNNSFLWSKVKQSDINHNTIPENISESELYDDVQNCRKYSQNGPSYAMISKSSDNLTETGKNNRVYLSADNLAGSIFYNDVDNIKNGIEQQDEADSNGPVDFQPDLVKATPAVVLEDDADFNSLYDDEDQMTLYESIAGSLLKLDKIEVKTVEKQTAILMA